MPREFALPGTRARYAPDRAIDVEHYRIAVDLHPQERRIDGTTTITAVVVAGGLRHVELDAVELELEAVTVDGEPAAGFAHDGQRLRVDLGGARARGDRLTLVVRYRAQPRRGLYFTAPDAGYPDKPAMAWTQGQDHDSRHWFVCLDSPHQKATSEVLATVPAAWDVLSNGVRVADRTDGADGGRRTVHWRLDVPHSCYLVTLVAGELATIEERHGELPVTYHVVRGREDEARRTLARTPQMIELFERRFGVAYPYPRYATVFVADFIFGGMENTSATTLTDTVLLDARAALDHDIDALVAHELAHQWFGDLVTCRDWGEGWLNEGFATYAEYLWREHHEGRDAADLELDEWAEMIFGEDGGRYRRTVATKLYDEPIDIFDHHLYEKGGRVLHMLRHELGDDAFFATLAHYLGKHRGGVVETRDLARAVEEATGRVLDGFFSQWILDGAGHPELKVTIGWDADARRADVRVEQTQKVEGKTPLFRFGTRLRFRAGAGAAHDVEVDVPITVDDRQHLFHVPLAAEPTQAIFDPGGVILASVETDKSIALWTGQLAAATLAIDRIHAARALGKKGGSAALAALGRALEHDPCWAVRGAAAEALGVMRGDDARTALVRALVDEAHPRARRAIARALGAFRKDTIAGAALAAVVDRGDPSYFVEAEACLSLGKTRAAEAPALLRRAALRPSFGDVIRQHALRGLAEARDDSAFDVLVEATAWGRPSQGRRAAVGALAVLTRGRRDREAVRARERIEELLDDPDFRVQSAAIEGLAVQGDPAAIAALERLIGHAGDGRLRRRGREVVRDLGERTAQGEEVNRLRDELAELKSQYLALRDRVGKLEAPTRPPAPASPPARPRRGRAGKPPVRSRRTVSPRRKP
ncbi:MAG TPA: M1 family aminopeptidase [Kofleriaceae bacterium]|nr:M1 family aminopeptidase [Kofleriaceae bacterium]